VITTEALLTSPDAFGIATATPAQRAACRVIDGLPLGDLRAHADVLELVGGVEALERLPSERGIMPTEVVFLASIRSAKTIIAAAAAIRMTQTVDVSRLGPGEVPRVSIVSLKLDTSAVARSILLETIRSSRVLKPLLIDDSGDVIVVRHPSGRPIEIACVAGSKAGGGLVARWSAGVIFDEAPRMNGASDAVVNLDHARSAVLGRLLPGAQVLYIGSAWAPHGPVYELVQEHWRKPKAHIVVLRGTGPMLNPTWWTPERCADLQARDPIAYQTDVMGEFADPESGLLSPIAVRASTRDLPLELPHDSSRRYVAAVDPSEGSAGGNGFALVIVEIVEHSQTPQWIPDWLPELGDWRKPSARDQAPMNKYRVACAREWRGLKPDGTWREIASACRRYGLGEVRSDQYAAAANADIARRHGIHVQVEPTTAASKLESWTNTATLLHQGQIELPPDPVVLRDLLNVKRRTTQAGSTIVLPRTSDGRHADLAAALCGAVAEGAEAPWSTASIRVRNL
jgi:hypothetical protein